MFTAGTSHGLTQIFVSVIEHADRTRPVLHDGAGKWAVKLGRFHPSGNMSLATKERVLSDILITSCDGGPVCR